MIPLLRTRLDRYALPLVLSGAAAAAIYNWRLWERDKAFLARKGEAEPLLPLESWPERSMVSVLVAAWNEREHIERHIESFLALRYPHKELVLCAGGEDGTLALASRYAGPQVKVFEQKPGEGKQKALARCFAETRGEIIFLTDADCQLGDNAFERILWAIIGEREQVATGSSEPYVEQMSELFAFTQAACQVYSTMHSPRYAPGILGRNCAVERELLEGTAALDEPAPTGTDYVLAKVLDASGALIRQVPESLMPTDYPGTAREYLRQQRRWLRNVVLHGYRFGAHEEMRASLRTSLLGLAMLFLPLLGFVLSPWLFLIWLLLSAQALFSRLRYLSFGSKIFDRPLLVADVVWQVPLLFLDFLAWTGPLADYVRQREKWDW